MVTMPAEETALQSSLKTTGKDECIMNSISETVIEQRQPDGAKRSDICPALILADRVMCDALGQLYQPSRRQIRECCTKEYHFLCSLRRPA